MRGGPRWSGLSGDTDVGPVLDFLRTLWSLNHAIEKTSKRMKREFGVTTQQSTVLRIVGRFPGISAGHLASLLRVHPSTLSAALNRLEQRGLLERRKDPRDQRRVLLGLTREGRALDLPAHDLVGDAVAAVLKVFPAAQTSATREVLSELITSLDPSPEALRLAARWRSDAPNDQSSSPCPGSMRTRSGK